MSAAASLQSALAPHGPEAAGIAQLALVMTVGAALILGLVVALAILALRSPRPWLARPQAILALGVALPAVVLSALMVYATVAVPRPYTEDEPAVRIELVGRQWWWEVRYLDDRGERDFTTANEIHIPRGRPVEVALESADVLHSFWVPALAGKLDLVPGRRNVLRLAADNAGVYRGQCAEYCGGPHGLMALHVVARDDAGFEAWRAAQRGAAAPAQGVAGQGGALFGQLCASCHTVRGTGATGTLGPDLTHVASRIALGAGTLANDAEGRKRWITAAQRHKPGSLMPDFRSLPPGEVDALAAYLETLR